MSGEPVETKETVSDYRDVSGIKTAHKINLAQGGKPTGEIVVTEAKLNSGLTAEQLSKKP